MEPIKPLENVPLSQHSTMRLGGPAKYLLDITEASQIEPALKWAESKNCRVIMIGDGSNIVWNDQGFDGLVLVNKIKKFEIEDYLYDLLTLKIIEMKSLKEIGISNIALKDIEPLLAQQIGKNKRNDRA